MARTSFWITCVLLITGCGGSEEGPGDGAEDGADEGEPIVLTGDAVTPIPFEEVDLTPAIPDTYYPAGGEVFRNVLTLDKAYEEADTNDCSESDTLDIEFRWRGPIGVGPVHRWGEEPPEPDPLIAYLERLRGPTHYELCVSADPARPCTGNDQEAVYKPVPVGASFEAQLPKEKFYLRDFTWQMKACNDASCSPWSPPVQSFWGFSGPVTLNTRVATEVQSDGSTKREIVFRYCTVNKSNDTAVANQHTEFLCLVKPTGNAPVTSSPYPDCTTLLLGDANGNLNGAIRTELEKEVRVEEVDGGGAAIEKNEWPAVFGGSLFWTVGVCVKDQTLVDRKACGFSTQALRWVQVPVWSSPP